MYDENITIYYARNTMLGELTLQDLCNTNKWTMKFKYQCPLVMVLPSSAQPKPQPSFTLAWLRWYYNHKIHVNLVQITVLNLGKCNQSPNLH